ncbi:MAG: outer membrane protein assembly factor BamA [Nibricoccus sp.]
MKTSLSSPAARAVRYLVVFIFAVFAGLRLAAQVSGDAEARPYKVGSITVRFVGTANVNEQVVRANMQAREGNELDDTMIDRDIQSLYRTGLFEFIEVKREVLPGRVINLVVEVTPKYRVLSIRYAGNEKIKSRRLEKEIKTKPNSSLDERQVKEDAEKIREFYQKSGFNQVSINYTIERDRATGYGTVIFKIKEGPKVKIADIRFIGNAHVKASKLRKAMDTKRWWMFSWLTGSGRYKDDQFEDDLDKLRDYYREQGYLDVEVPQEKIIYDYPEPSKLVITIQVSEGRQYHIGTVTFSGNKIYPSRLLALLVQQGSGMIFAPSKLDKDVEMLEDFYGKDGYLETRVRLVRKPNIATGNIDIEYMITESEQFFVESVKIEGNTKSKSIVVIRELTLGPGEIFDTISMKRSKLRLENTRFFDDVNVTHESTNIPGRRNLKVAVKEGRTGNLQFGAGFSSLEKAVFFAELSQSNFDLFNRKGFFQGDGQKFRIRLQIGSVSSEAMLSFEEPWFLEKELALGFSIYRTSQNYDNSYYERVDTGGEIYTRKRLFELVVGRLSYNYTETKIQDIDPIAYLYGARPGKTNVSKVGLQLERDTRDKIINTTDGGRVELNLDVAGGPLGGSYDYYRIEARTSQFFPIFKAQDQVIGVIGRFGVLDSYRESEVPYYELFTLGGPYTLRGFEQRDVGPRQSGYVIGGKTYGMLSIEYSVDIVSPVRFAVFYDAGFVNAGSYDFNPAYYNDNFGFGLRLFVAGAPLSLDFGIPLTTDKFNDKGNQFNFSFGTRF